ncbi:MAG: hypothetical protein AUG45_05915 [Ktedonobacter sp. 13_1_20CM_3_54_15]|nr:MAG: hypothetical protein AUG45_05915 [Ktedonobacter sp. 13_1_20CM_3_54_15]
MSGGSFELLMDEVLNQKRIMDELLAENHSLRRQLADLRGGRGIFLELQGQIFALDGETVFRSPEVDSTAQDFSIAEQATTFMPASETMEQTMTIMPVSETMEQTMTIMPVSEAGIATGTSKETPMPSTEPFEQLSYSLNSEEEGEASETTSTFLEDMLEDEFATAVTSQMAVWKGAKKTRKLTGIDEEEKATLRKELIGSFLLE